MKLAHDTISDYQKSLVFIIFLYILMHFISPSQALAAEDISLEVEPAVSMVEILEPGTEESVLFSLTNRSDHPETVRFQLFPIEKVDKKTNRLIYQSNSQLSESQQSFYENAISFSVDGKPASKITIPPRQTRQVETIIRYNNSQNASEYYTTIGFLSDSEGNLYENSEDTVEANITIHGGVGSHLLVSLGKKESEVKIDSVVPTLQSSNTPDISIHLTNLVSKTTKLYGNISISNSLGMDIASFDTPDIYLLGDESKVISFRDDNFTSNGPLGVFSIGPHTVTVTLYNSVSKTQLTAEQTYIYFPTRQFVLAITVFVVIIILLRKLQKKVT